MFNHLKRTISAILIIVIIFLLIPCVNAEERTISVFDYEELSRALDSTYDNRTVKLEDDIILSYADYTEVVFTVNGNITLDVNGFAITVTNNAVLNSKYDDSTLFKVTSGSSLTVTDTSPSKAGKIEFFGGIIPAPSHNNKNSITAITSVDTFYVDGNATLTLNDVTVTAGNSSAQWLHDAISITEGGFKYDSALTNQVVCGTVVTVGNNGKLVINGGKYTANGRSRGNSLPNFKGWDSEKPASVCIRAEDGSEVRVNDGNFTGDNGANVFDINIRSNTVIKGGSFKCSPVCNERAADYDGRHAFISGDYCGKIELPLRAVHSKARGAFRKNGALLDTSSLPIIRESDGETITLSPSTHISPSITSEGIITSYTSGNNASLNVNYEPYFDNASVVSYEWYVLLPSSIQMTLPFTDKTLDLKALSSSGLFEFLPNSDYEFGCIVTEKFNITNSYTLTTISQNHKVTTSDKKVIPSISLTPSDVNSKNEYKEGKVPSFSVSKNSNYVLNDIKWYSINDNVTYNVTELIENREYLAVFRLAGKNGYRFSSDTRVSFLPGGEDITVVPSKDGSFATIFAKLSTECTHTSTRIIYDHVKHSVFCNICAEMIVSESHTYSEWKVSDSDDSLYCRDCSICSYEETSAFIDNASTEKISIPSIYIDFGQIYYKNSPASIIPKLYDAPSSSYVTITDHSWTTEDGASFKTFDFDKPYILTVDLVINDPEKYSFANDLSVQTKYNSRTKVNVSEDGTSATVKFTVYTLKEIVSSLTLPEVNIGSLITSSLPVTPLNCFKLIWAENGNIIGSYEFKNGNAVNITDLNENDGIDFVTHRYESGKIYTLYVDWNTYPTSQVIYEGKGNVRIDPSNATSYTFFKGFCGTLLAKYDLNTKVSRLPVISVNGITKPTADTAPDKTAIVSDGKYKISSVKWTLNNSEVSSFDCLKEYTVHVTVTLNGSHSFFIDELKGMINGVEADISISGNKAVLSYTFPSTAHIISQDKQVAAPDCVSDGSITVVCSHCNYMNSLTVKKTEHPLTYVRALEPTCNNEGLDAHLKCTFCNNYYTDIDGTATTLSNITLPKSDHLLIENCFDNKHHFSSCSVCFDASENKSEHVLNEADPLPDGTSVKLCQCGYAYYFTPIQSEITIDPDQTPVGIGSIPMDKLKLLVFAAIGFIVVIFLMIITLSLYLILTRRSYKLLIGQIEESSAPEADPRTETLNDQENNTSEEKAE